MRRFLDSLETQTLWSARLFGTAGTTWVCSQSSRVEVRAASMAKDTGEDERKRQPVSRRGRSLREAPASRRTARPAQRAEPASRSWFRFEERSVGTRPRLPPLHRTGRRRPGRRVHRLGARQVARNLAVGDDRVSLARLCRRRHQRDARRGRFQRTGTKAAIGAGDRTAGSFRRWPIRFINSKSTTSCRSATSAGTRSRSPIRRCSWRSWWSASRRC